ncbi:MAG: DUF3459 domain-containing protein, partial [Microcella sp.]|nr:DUF3459 domain-containing protein [Microcella sp.]
AGTYSSFRERDHGHPIPDQVPTWRLVTCAQNHDQIGNRAAGDRLSALVDYDLLAVAAVLNLTSPFTPMLFMGEEWGASTPWQFFTSHPEPDLGRATAEGRLTEFVKMGWDESVVPDPQDPATFERSRLDWGELTGDGHARLLALHRELIALRRSTPELTDPSFAHTSAASSGAEASARPEVFRMLRGPGVVDPSLGLIAVCVAFEHQSVMEFTAPVAELLLATGDARLHVDDEAGVSQLELPARSAAIVRLR